MTTKVTELKNGLRVATQHMPHLETVSLGVWVGTGARHEAPEEHGIAHLLEHMAFKGTPKRSARQIAEDIENVGGDLNAATSLETTAYYARVLKADVPLALDIVSDILLNPEFDAEELRREQDVILQEIAASQDSPDDQVYDLAQDRAYPDQPLGRTILGTPESVAQLTPDDLRRYLERHYGPEKMVLGAAGAVDHDQVVEEAERLFSGFERREAFEPAPAIYSGGEAHAKRRFEQSHLLLGFNGPTFLDDGYYPAQVFSNLFGGGMSSRLFQEIREGRGLCYSIYSFCWGLSDAGMFSIHAASGAEQMEELADVTLAELANIAEKGPSETEVVRAKTQLKAGLLMGLESSSGRAEQLARQVLAFGHPVTVEDLTAKIDAVTAQSVQKTAEHILSSGALTLSTAGDTGRLKSYDKLQALYN